MKARAPGKLVLSGAYAVLRGAPAIVTAVDRYAEVDTAREPTFVTPEVAAALRALPGARAPWFDASALRDERGKLGLGSSAAIVVASLAALEAERSGDVESLGERVLDAALVAHREAQGGGSGIDVAAAALGGTLLFRSEAAATARSAQSSHAVQTTTHAGRTLRIESLPLPPNLHLEVWVMGEPASTAELVRQVLSLEARDPELFSRLLGAQTAAAVRAETALRARDARGLVDALAAQHEALSALGDASGAPIVTPAVRSLHERAMPGATVLPSGAGGGDVSLYAGLAPSNAEFRKAAEELGLFLLEVELGARGAHA
jgi:phosphomevalonate kinase